jgi:putative zinc finger/helix-turn-helix YgiT family protein
MIKQIMKSPFSGGNAVLHCEQSSLTFRKEEFSYVHQFYVCEETHERFTTTELDEVNIAQVYNKYRAKYGIPFPEEIKRIRRHYGLSATKMSEILGFGENQYRLYENGDMPSEANGKVLMSIMNPDFFRIFIENARGQFSEDEYAKLTAKASAWKNEKYPQYLVEYVFMTNRRSAYNGYATQSIDKLKNILLYFIERCNGVFFTKMNKLLFYTDFLSYRMLGKGLTGLAYKAIAHGPVPLRWDRIYSFYDEINQEIVQFKDDRVGTMLVSKLSPDMAEFSDEELNILEYVYQRFKNETPKQISETSHHEEAWLRNLNSDQLINFEMAFSLKAI